MSDKITKIYDAALKLFASRGFHGTSTAMIAKEAGVATGTLFHHFKTKEDLIDKLYLHIKEKLFLEIRGNFTQQEHFKDTLFVMWKAAVVWFRDHYDEFMFTTQVGCSPYITKLTKEKLENNFKFTRDMMQDAIAKKEIKDIDNDLLCQLMHAHITALVNYSRMHPEKATDTLIEEAFETMWEGIQHKG